MAARAGVSRATASRAVTGHPRVTDETRAAVERAAEQLGYIPNRAARSLASHRTETVALVVSEPSVHLFADPFFAGTIRGIGAGLAGSRYQLVLLMAQSDDDGERVERHLLRGNADGVLLLSSRTDDPLPGRLREAGIPCVLAGRPAEGTGVSYVDADNVGGAEQAVAHLLAQGRTTIATVSGPLAQAPGADRLTGWRKALLDAGHRPLRTLAVAGDFTRAGGTAAATTLLAKRPDIDGIFAASDLMAIGVLDALRRAGRRVPDDVAVVGFDDSGLAESTDPPLTTVRQPIDDIGWHMADLLLDQLDRGAGPGNVVLPTELVLRRSG
ncbi:MAG TPA: LacI family DNA-binding transcriptional regulator [Acidimicrobiales bacterium]|nr:LacI family DNA-binding transcriptional regulator [Acidimicrobiales bacterium]